MGNAHENLVSLFSDIADRLRAKLGTSEAIVADQFPDKINSLPALSEIIKLSEIVVTSAPNKVAYIAKESFNPSGIEVKAIFSNGAYKFVNNLSYEPSGELKATDTKVKVIYMELGTTAETSVAISVEAISIPIPTINTTNIIYTGSSITPTWNNYDSSLMTIGGSTSGTNAGTYTVTFTLKDTTNYQWSDGTTTAKSVQWSIGKAQASVTLNKSSVTLSADKLTDTVTITTVGMKSVTAKSANTAVATVTQSGNVLTISSVNDTTGNTTITLSGTVDNNYNAPQYPSITVEAEFIIYIDTVPTANVVAWTGSEVSPTWNNYDSAQLAIGGTTSATDAGTYTATFTPKEGYCWLDGTTTAKSVSWTVKCNWSEMLKDFNYTENSDGTATITGWKQTLNGVASTELVIPNNSKIIL